MLISFSSSFREHPASSIITAIHIENNSIAPFLANKAKWKKINNYQQTKRMNLDIGGMWGQPHIIGVIVSGFNISRELSSNI
jgi:hypothetical protein